MKNERLNMKKTKTKMIAESGMLAALSVVILLLGSVIDTLDLSCAVLAGFAALAMRIRHGRAGAVAVYITTSVLGFLLLPNKIPVVLYMFYGGIYPIIKPEIERLRSVVLQWVLKIVSVLVLFTIGLVVITFILGMESGFTVGIPLYLLLIVVAVCTDIAITAIVRRFGPVVAGKRR